VKRKPQLPLSARAASGLPVLHNSSHNLYQKHTATANVHPADEYLMGYYIKSRVPELDLNSTGAGATADPEVSEYPKPDPAATPGRAAHDMQDAQSARADSEHAQRGRPQPRCTDYDQAICLRRRPKLSQDDDALLITSGMLDAVYANPAVDKQAHPCWHGKQQGVSIGGRKQEPCSPGLSCDTGLPRMANSGPVSQVGHDTGGSAGSSGLLIGSFRPEQASHSKSRRFCSGQTIKKMKEGDAGQRRGADSCAAAAGDDGCGRSRGSCTAAARDEGEAGHGRSRGSCAGNSGDENGAPRDRSTGICEVAARRAAVWKLEALQAASAASLAELEQLLTEEHLQA
jgi:hypothetical protein